MICSISYNDAEITTVTTLDDRCAVGLYNGQVKLYRTSTCEELTTLVHDTDPFADSGISILQFGAILRLLASVGQAFLKLWDTVEGKELFSIQAGSQTLAMAFNEAISLIFLASSDKHISSIKTTDGSFQHKFKLAWTDTFVETYGEYYLIAISIEQQVVAVFVKGGHQPVQLWYLQKQRSIGICLPQSELSDAVMSISFNPNPAYQRVVVSYRDGSLVVFDTSTCRQLVCTKAGLDHRSESIKIYNSETLQFLHSIPPMDIGIESLVFTTDNLRIIDVREDQLNIWEPTILVSQDSYSSISEPGGSVRRAIEDLEAPLVTQPSRITILHCCEKTGVAFCGRADGYITT